MKKVTFNSLTLISSRERAAARFKFGRKTLVKGDNDTGKSCLIKSLYWTLGGAVPDIPQPWPQLGITAILDLSVDGEISTFVRRGNTYSIFKGDDRVVGVYRDVSTSLSRTVSEIFDFKLRLKAHGEDFLQATPAFLYLPFYIDQDHGWSNLFGSFSNLGQFKSYRKETIQYHFGIRGDRYFELISQKADLGIELEEAQDARRTLGRLREYTFPEDLNGVTLNVEDFEGDLQKLVVDVELLRDEQRSVELHTRELLEERNRLLAEKLILESSVDEMMDSKRESLLQQQVVSCPTCSAEYTNDFAARFSLANDIEFCREQLDKVQTALEALERKINSSAAASQMLRDRAGAVESHMRLTQQAVELNDVIRNAGLSVVRSGIDGDINEADRLVGRLMAQMDGVNEAISDETDAAHTRMTTKFYSEQVRRLLDELDVSEVNEGSIARYWQRIQQSGSDSPRARLAQAVATLLTIGQNDRATVFPFVVDSPNQQDQDNFNLESMFDVLARETGRLTQLIVGGVSGGDASEFDEVIHLKETRQLLQSSEYDTHSARLSNLSEMASRFERNVES